MPVALLTYLPRLAAVLRAVRDRVLPELEALQAFSEDSEAVQELELVSVQTLVPAARVRVKIKLRLAVLEISPAFLEA